MKTTICLVITLIGLAANAKSDSTYTSIASKDCKVLQDSNLDPNAPIDYYTGHCNGLNGYTVVVSGGDIRYSVSLIYNKKEIQLTHIGAFHDVGSEKVEWRGTTDKNGKISKYSSLIYRLVIDQYDDQTTNYNRKNTLFVVRLNGVKSCVVGQVSQGPNMNEQARQIADNSANLKCVELDNN